MTRDQRTHSPTHAERIDPPTLEQWQALAPWQRWYIFALVLSATWEFALAEIGLKIGGAV